MTVSFDQEYFNETADELNFYTDEIETALEQYEEGEVDENYLNRLAAKANETYVELKEATDEVLEQRKEHDVLDELQEILEESNYDSPAQFIAGEEPITAGDQDTERQVLDEWLDDSFPEIQKATEAMTRYTNTRSKAYQEHGVKLPKPDYEIDSKHREIMELVREGMSVEEAKKQVTGEENL